MRRVRVVVPLRLPVPFAFVLALAGVRDVVVERPFAGARPVEVVRAPEERRSDAPWREDPARPLGRGLRLVAVTVSERYRATPADPGNPLTSARPVPTTHGVKKNTFAL